MNEACAAILAKRFGADSLMALATVDETGNPWVRTIDAIFVGDSFYTITHGSSHKMEHLRRDPRAAISGDWFSGHALCAGLGFIPEPAGFGKWVLVLLALLFFLPGGILLYRAIRAGNRVICRRIRLLSACSLALTVLAIIGNFLTYSASASAGMVMHILLVLVSVPMVCGQVWVISLFLWACLLLTSHSYLRSAGNAC